MSQKNFNVSVVGLSGVDSSGVNYKVGKSLFCNRFVRPAYDDLCLEHGSIYEEEYLKGNVINSDNFLYWGSVSMRVENSSSNAQFNVIEWTYLRSDPRSILPLNKYIKESISTTLKSPGKCMYISRDQVKNPDNYDKVKMPGNECLDVDGFIVIYNVDPNITYSSVQAEFVMYVISEIRKAKKPVIVAASKCDKIMDNLNITEMVLAQISSTTGACLYDIPIIETSAFSNINVVSAFQFLYSYSDHRCKAKLKIKSYMDAFRTVVTRTTVIVDSFSQLVRSKFNFCSLTFDDFSNEFRDSSKLKLALEIFGKEGLQTIFYDCITKKQNQLKEKLTQHYLNRFEHCLVHIIPNLEHFNHKDFTNESFLTHVSTHPDFNTWFQEDCPEGESWDSLKCLGEFSKALEKKEVDQKFSKIPREILSMERSQVVLTQYISRLVGITCQHRIKEELEKEFREMCDKKQFTIKTSLADVVALFHSSNKSELAESLSEPSLKEVFNRVSQRLLLVAKVALHELLFENSSAISKIVYENKQQIVDAFSAVVSDDPRFKQFDGSLEQLRANWCFTHFTFFRSHTHCLLSPLLPCSDRLAKSAMRSLSEQLNYKDQMHLYDDMVLFVIAPEDACAIFEKEFLEQCTPQNQGDGHILMIHGSERRVFLAKVCSLDVDWGAILETHKHSKFSFVAIYGDANSYKFIEASLAKLYSSFHLTAKRREGQRDLDSINDIELISQTPSLLNSMLNMNNIVILFCLKSHIIDDFRTFIVRMEEESSFFQESMLGRLLEQGRNLSSKYSAKLIEPYLDEIIQSQVVKPLHETQVSDSLKYLSETIYDVNNTLFKKYTSARLIKIIVCCMCGDNYPLEIIMGLFLYGRQFEYSFRNETLYFEVGTNMGAEDNSPKYLVSLRFVSYHSAYVLVNKEHYYGCVLVYNSEREASYQVMSDFRERSNIENFHIIGMRGSSTGASIFSQTTFTPDNVRSFTREKVNEQQQSKKSRSSTSSDNSTHAHHQHKSLNDLDHQIQRFEDFLLSCISTLSKINHQIGRDDFTGGAGYNSRDSCLEGEVKYSTLQYFKKHSSSNTKKGSILSKKNRDDGGILGGGTVRPDSPLISVDWADNPAFSQDFIKSIESSGSQFSLSNHDQYKTLSTPRMRRPSSIRGLKNATKRLFDRISAEVKLEHERSSYNVPPTATFNNTPITAVVAATSDLVLSETQRNADAPASSITVTSSTGGGSLPGATYEISKSKKGTPNILTNLKAKKKKSEKAVYEQRMLEWDNIRNRQVKANKSTYFGQALKDLPLACGVPVFVIKCIAYIDEHAVRTEGIYRVSGNKHDIETLKSSFETDHNTDFNALGFSNHVFSGALKSFLAMLPVPLIPPEVYPDILNATSHPDANSRISKLKILSDSLSNVNHATLSYIMHHLAKVSTHKEDNKMDARNLAICFWPTLMKVSSDSVGVINGSSVHFCLFIHTLIENCCTILGDCPQPTHEEMMAQQKVLLKVDSETSADNAQTDTRKRSNT